MILLRALGRVAFVTTTLLVVTAVSASCVFAEEPAASVALNDSTPARNSPNLDQFGDPLPNGAIWRLGSVRFLHDSKVQSIAYSPDGTMIAVGGATRQYSSNPHWFFGHPLKTANASQVPRANISLFDAHTGKLIWRKSAHDFVVTALTFTANSGQLISVGCDRRIISWEAATGEIRLAGNVFNSAPLRLALHANRGIVGAIDAVGRISVWKLDDLTLITSIDTKLESSPGLAFCNQGLAIVASGGKPNLTWEMGIWEIESGQRKLKRQGKGAAATTCLLAADEAVLYANGSLTYFEGASAKETHTLRLPNPQTTPPASFHVDGSVLLMCEQDELWLLNTLDGSVRFRRSIARPLNLLPAAIQGELLYIAQDQRVQRIQITDDDTPQRPPAHVLPMNSLAVLPSRGEFVSSSDDSIIIANIKNCEGARAIPRPIKHSASLLDGLRLVTPRDENVIGMATFGGRNLHLWDIATNSYSREYSLRTTFVGFAGTHTHVISRSNNTIILFDLETKVENIIGQPQSSVRYAATDRTGSWIVLVDADGGVHRVDIGSGKDTVVARLATDPLRTRFSLTDATLFAIEGDHRDGAVGSVISLDANDVRSFSIARLSVASLAAIPQRHLVAIGDFEGRIIFLDDRTGKEMGRVFAHSGAASVLCASSSEPWLLSGGGDGNVVAWNCRF